MKTPLLQRPTALAALTIIGIGYFIGVKLAAPKRFGYFAENTDREEAVEQTKAELDIIAADMRKISENAFAECRADHEQRAITDILARAHDRFPDNAWEANATMRKELNELRCGRAIRRKATERR